MAACRHRSCGGWPCRNCITAATQSRIETDRLGILELRRARRGFCHEPLEARVMRAVRTKTAVDAECPVGQPERSERRKQIHSAT